MSAAMDFPRPHGVVLAERSDPEASSFRSENGRTLRQRIYTTEACAEMAHPRAAMIAAVDDTPDPVAVARRLANAMLVYEQRRINELLVLNENAPGLGMEGYRHHLREALTKLHAPRVRLPDGTEI